MCMRSTQLVATSLFSCKEPRQRKALKRDSYRITVWLVYPHPVCRPARVSRKENNSQFVTNQLYLPVRNSNKEKHLRKVSRETQTRKSRRQKV